MLDCHREGTSVTADVQPQNEGVELPEAWKDFFEKTGAAPLAYHDLRAFRRYYFRGCAALEHRQTFPALARSGVWHGVFTKDLSRSGVAFYHGAELFPKERMRILLPGGRERIIQVVRCRRIQDRCYEIGAQFVKTFYNRCDR